MHDERLLDGRLPKGQMKRAEQVDEKREEQGVGEQHKDGPLDGVERS